MKSLMEQHLNADPFAQFIQWFDEAKSHAAILQPDAMSVATIDEKGYPDVRLLLLKGIDHRGFVFYTNMNSVKGKSIQKTPKASLAFFWEVLERQIRVMGDIVNVSEEEADAYFLSRPRLSQLGAWASQQSEILSDRKILDDRVAELEKKYEGKEIPRPPHWKGNRVVPFRIEFWQGRLNRLHDRFIYEKKGDQWHIHRLYP